MKESKWFTSFAFVMGLLTLVALWRSLCIFRLIFQKKHVSSSYMQYLLSVRSAFIFLAMVVPISVSSVWDAFPSNLKQLYCWSPFWFCFMVTPTLGSTLHVLHHVFRGVAIATIALLLLNYLMPGGAGSETHNTDVHKYSWLPGGYNIAFAYVYILSFVYLTFASRLTVDTKYFVLAMFSQSIVMYLDPSSNCFINGALWNWQWIPSWSSPVFCQIYVILFAAACSVLAVPVVSCTRQRRVDYLSKAQVNSGLQDLARDSIACLDKLILHFREETSAYALASSYLYIRKLGARRTAIEKLLYEARWECCGKASLERLLRAGQFSDLLRAFRQVLRIELDLLRSNNELNVYNPDTLASDTPGYVYFDHLCIFLVSCRDALETMTGDGSDVGRPLPTETREAVEKLILHADEALRGALKTLRPNSKSQSSLIATAFVDSLRICTSSMMEFLHAARAEDPRPSAMTRLKLARLCSSCEQHMNALRNTISWMLALFWSLYQRGYESGCVVCLSFVFSKSTGSLFDRNINRMLGVAMGLILGNLPAVMLMEEPGISGDLGSFVEQPQGIIIYLCAMFLTWTLSMYGYLGTGAKYSYGCMLWAGFAGTQMLWHLQNQNLSGEDSKAKIFMDMMDQFIACFIVLLVDLIFARFFGGLTLDRVAEAVPSCLDCVADLVESFIQKGPHETDISALQKSIANARFWDSEAQSEDLVWSLLWSAPYKGDLIQVILDHCDDVYVAAYAIQASSARCGIPTTKAILSSMFCTSSPRRAGGGSLADHVRQYARITRAALTEDERKPVAEKGSFNGLSMTPQCLRQERLEASIFENLSDNFAYDPFADNMESLEARLESLEKNLVTGSSNSLVPCSWSAAVAVKANACALRLALQRMQVLIREHEFWVSEAWVHESLQTDVRQQSFEDRFLVTPLPRSRASTIDEITSPSSGCQ